MEPKKVGSGTYGCVYYPPLSCESSQQFPMKVSKLMQREDALEEYRIYNRLGIDKLDPGEEFFVKSPILCEAKKDELSNLKGGETCEVEGADTLILYNYAGLSINTFPLATILHGMLNVFNGIQLLNKNKIYHCDIKSDNLLAGNGTIRLIDFGISTNYSKVMEDNDLFDNMYAYWPMEAYLIKEIPIESKQLIMMKRYFSQSLRSIEITKLDPTYTAHKNVDLYEKTIKYLIGLTPGERMKKILDKLDVFSLGVTLIKILASKIDEMTSEMEPLLDLVKLMTYPDIENRIDLESAKESFSEIIRNVPLKTKIPDTRVAPMPFVAPSLEKPRPPLPRYVPPPAPSFRLEPKVLGKPPLPPKAVFKLAPPVFIEPS